jgi:PAS domain S-box-containing protein
MSKATEMFTVFNGDGEVSGLITTLDWSVSPLGRPQTWPQELHTVVRLILGSKFPMMVAWGPELGMLYNDAYALILGDKHPGALGRRLRDVWPEIWPEVRQVIGDALAGKTSSFEDLPLIVNRKGYSEEAWFTLSCSPVQTGNGAVAGVYCTVVETTHRVRGEKRQAFQLTLADRLRPLTSPEEVIGTASELLGRYLGASRVCYAEIDDIARTFQMRGNWNAADMPALPDTGRIDDYGAGTFDALRSGKPFVVHDVAADRRTADSAEAYAAIGIRSLLVVALIKSGRLAITLNLTKAAAYHWTQEDVLVAQDVAERTWTAVERAGAEAQLRAERDRSQYIFDSVNEGFAIIDRDWTLVTVNAEGARIAQRERSELIGRNHWEALPETVGTKLETLYRRVRATGVPESCDYHPRLRSGQKIWVELRVYPSLDGGLAVFFRDITERKHTEEALRSSEMRSGSALAVAKLGTFDWNFRTKLVDASDRTREIFAFAENEGRTADDYFNRIVPDDVKRVQAEIAAAMKIDGRLHSEYRIRLPDNQIRHIVSMSTCLRDSKGAWIRHIGVFNDVTERRQAEMALRESRAHLSSLFEQTAAGIAETDLDGRLTIVNERFCEIVGRRPEQLIGHELRSIIFPDDREANFLLLENLMKTGEPFETENRYWRPDGSPVWVSKTVSLIRTAADKPAKSIMAIVLDITKRKQAEEELYKADRRKDEFLAMLAHELRNPLAPISAAAELMEMVQLDEARLKQTSQVITRQVRHMTGLVDDLLDVSRVTRGLVTIKKSAQDMKSIVANAVEQVRPIIEAQRHHLGIELDPDPAYVLGDQKRLIQIVTNLLNNAAKYTPEGGNVQLNMGVHDGQVILSVIDDGIGIALELQPRVFDLFAQAERTSDRSQGGLGLGLALVKSLVELHGGTVTCMSEGAGKGSRFTVCLPRLSEQENTFERRQSSRNLRLATRKLKVMVVDDHADAARMLAMSLEASGHEVVVEHGSRRALERARIEAPDVCVLDIGLPDLDGNELARRLRAQPETAGAMLIAVTGYGQEQDRKNALAAGFDFHLVKPVDTAQLAALIADGSSS